MVFNSGFRSIIAVILISMLIISGCVVIRKTTYPENFTYLERGTVTSSMQKLALSIDKIDRVLYDENSLSDTQARDIILVELNKMEMIANSLGAGTTNTNHLFIDQNIDRFKAEVVQARRFIEAEPSNYYMAGKLVGSCISCHILRPDQLILMNDN